jgi:hypothetical protein
VALEKVNSPVSDFQIERKSPSSDVQPVPQTNARRSRLIYNDAATNQQKDDEDDHPNRADKRAGWILLGLLVLSTIAMASDGP